MLWLVIPFGRPLGARCRPGKRLHRMCVGADGETGPRGAPVHREPHPCTPPTNTGMPTENNRTAKTVQGEEVREKHPLEWTLGDLGSHRQRVMLGCGKP